MSSIKLSGIKELKLICLTYLWQWKFSFHQQKIKQSDEKNKEKTTTPNTPTRNGSSNQTNLFLFAKMNLFTFWKRKAHSFDDDDYYLFIFFNKFKSTKFQVFSWWKVSLICLTKRLWYCCSQIKTKHRIPYVCCISVCECFFRLFFFHFCSSILRYTNTFIFSNK